MVFAQPERRATEATSNARRGFFILSPFGEAGYAGECKKKHTIGIKFGKTGRFGGSRVVWSTVWKRLGAVWGLGCARMRGKVASRGVNCTYGGEIGNFLLFSPPLCYVVRSFVAKNVGPWR